MILFFSLNNLGFSKTNKIETGIKMNVAVTGLNNVDSPGPGVPVIRGIRESDCYDCRIIGLIYDSLEPGAYMNNVADKNYLIPYPSGGIDNLYERIKFINEKEKIDVIIPTLDAELFAFAKLQPKLESLGIKMFLPTAKQIDMRGKDKLFKFTEQHDILSPKTSIINSVQDLYKIPTDFEYPVAIKGIFYDAKIVYNFDEALSAFNKISAKWGLPIIVQEFIEGDEYNVCALGNGEGEMVSAVAMKKTYITDKGKAWGGVTINDRELLDISRKLIEVTEWKGGAEFEFVKEKKTGKYNLLEINPRFPAWVYLTVGAGHNQPAALLDLANGKSVKPFGDYKIGKMFIRYSWDLITDISEFEKLSVNGELEH